MIPPAAAPLDHATYVATSDASHSGKHSRSTTRRGAPEDPFNLAGFFPSRPTAWKWINGHGDDVVNNDVADRDFSVSSMLGKYKRDQSYDEIACKVIEEEDKYGMLAFSTETFSSLLPWKMPIFGRTMLSEHAESGLTIDEPADLEALHSKHCMRREAVIEQDAEEGLEIGQLFFSSEEEMTRMGMSWAKMVLSRLESVLGEL